jgi:hypothetical protein
VSRSGVLNKGRPDRSQPSLYYLAERRDGTYVVVCYVKGNREQLEKLLGRAMRIEGKETPARGGRQPVLAPQRIYLDAPSPRSD